MAVTASLAGKIVIRQVDLAWAALGVVEPRRERLHPERIPEDRVNSIEPTGSRYERGSRAAAPATLVPQLRVAPATARSR